MVLAVVPVAIATIGPGDWSLDHAVKLSDHVATEAMRHTMDSVPMDGTIVIGEGERDEAPMLYIGEKVGAKFPDGKDVPQVDIAVVPIGGGGLISGVSMALKALNPKIKIIGVESSDGPGMKRSIEAGHVVTLDKIDCIIDGLRVKRVGENNFSIVQRFVDDIVTLPDKEIFEAMIWIMSHAKLVVEGAAAAPVAALLHGLIKAPAGSKVAVKRYQYRIAEIRDLSRGGDIFSRDATVERGPR